MSAHLARRRLLSGLLAGALAPLATSLARAATGPFPARPVRVIVPFAAGNTLDAALRLVGERYRERTGQPLIIEARPGGSGVIAARAGATAAPDGYTLLLANTGMLTINPHTFASLPYDAVRDFRPVSGFLGSSLVFAVHPSVPASTLPAFVAWARARPGKLSFASFTAGNSSHLAGVLLNQRAGLDMVHVPYNGTPPAVQNLVGGQVQAAFLPLLAVQPHLEAGRLKILATTAAARSPLAASVPTFRELGYPDLEIDIWAALVAPAGTPDAVVARLNGDFAAILRGADLRQRWQAWDFVAQPSTPQALAARIQDESGRWAEAVRLSGFRASQ